MGDVKTMLTHGFCCSGTMTLQNKQSALGMAAEFVLRRESWGRLRKLSGRSTLLGKILFNIIWVRPLAPSLTHKDARQPRCQMYTYTCCSSFLPTDEWGKGWTVAAAHVTTWWAACTVHSEHIPAQAFKSQDLRYAWDTSRKFKCELNSY